MVFAGRHLRRDGQLFFQNHIARIQPLGHIHHRDPADGIARHNGAVDRRRAAPARQQRRVDIDAAERRQRQNLGRKQFAVSGDDEHIRTDGAEGLARGFVPQRERLKDLYAARKGVVLDGRRRELMPAAARLIGVGHDESDVVAAVLAERAQRFGGEGRRAHKHNAHHSLKSRASALKISLALSTYSTPSRWSYS